MSFSDALPASRLAATRWCAFVLAALTTPALPAPALAQTAASGTGNIALSGRVAPVCILGAPSQTTIDLGQLAAGSGARAGRIATIAPQGVTLPGSFCNFAGSTVTIAASALVSADATTPPGGFARAVNYTATASNWAAGNASATTNTLANGALANGAAQSSTATGATQTVPQLADIALALSAFAAPGDAILISGTYSGSVTITLGPALTQ